MLWLPFIFQRHEERAPQRNSSAAVRRRRHRAQQSNVPAQRRARRLLLGAQRLHGLRARGSIGAAPPARRHGDPGGSSTTPTGTTNGSTAFSAGESASRTRRSATACTNKAISWSHQQDFSHDSHFNSEPQLTSRARRCSGRTRSIRTRRSRRSRRRRRISPSLVRRRSRSARRESNIPDASRSIRRFRRCRLTSTAIGIGSWLTLDAKLQLQPQRRAAHGSAGNRSLRILHRMRRGARDSVAVENAQRRRIRRSRSTRRCRSSARTSRTHSGSRSSGTTSPQQFPIYDVETGEITDTRVFAATYRTDIDWTPDFSLPPLARNRFNLTPSLSLQNVDPGPFWVRRSAANGQFVHQSKRFTAGLSASPTLFGLFRGFGPFQRIRHRSARPSATRSRRRRMSATNTCARSVERERATSAA